MKNQTQAKVEDQDFMDILFDDSLSEEEAERRMLEYLDGFPPGEAPNILGPSMFATNPPGQEPINASDS